MTVSGSYIELSRTNEYITLLLRLAFFMFKQVFQLLHAAIYMSLFLLVI